MSGKYFRLLCITDPKTHPERDATVHLYYYLAQRHDIKLYHTDVSQITEDDKISYREVKTDDLKNYQDFLNLSQNLEIDGELTDFDCVYGREDLPVPDNFYSILSKVESEVQFVSRPSTRIYSQSAQFINHAIGRYLLPHIYFQNTTDPRQFTSDFALVNIDEAVAFLIENQVCVAKLSGSYGGKGVYKISLLENSWRLENSKAELKTFESAISLLLYLCTINPEPIQLVKFAKNIGVGDKRILVQDGEIVGCCLRKSKEGWIHNLTLGGDPLPSKVEPREAEIISATCLAYHAIGQFFLGYDFLCDEEPVLSEINCGNVGAMYGIYKVDNPNIFALHTDWIIAKARAGKFFAR